MTVFYRGPLATITHEVISVPRVERRILAIGELVAVRVVRVGSAATVARHRALGVSALVTAFFVVPLVGPASPVLALVLGCALLVCAAVCVRVRSEIRYQLVALIDHDWVTLVETADRVEFEQVGRGLQRALESREELPRQL